eukprot:COSAG05_NODE_2012_length_3699_cov_7.187778_1_plen_687_part_10
MCSQDFADFRPRFEGILSNPVPRYTGCRCYSAWAYSYTQDQCRRPRDCQRFRGEDVCAAISSSRHHMVIPARWLFGFGLALLRSAEADDGSGSGSGSWGSSGSFSQSGSWTLNEDSVQTTVVAAELSISLPMTAIVAVLESTNSVTRMAFESAFETDIAAMLDIDASRVHVTGITSGTDTGRRRLQSGSAYLIVDFEVTSNPATMGADDITVTATGFAATIPATISLATLAADPTLASAGISVPSTLNSSQMSAPTETLTCTGNCNNLPTLSAVVIASNNVGGADVATTGNIITVTMHASVAITIPTCTFSSGGSPITGAVTVAAATGSSNTSWACQFTVQPGDTDGTVAFIINFDAASTGEDGASVTAATAGTPVAIDQTVPVISVVSLLSSNAASTAMTGTDIGLPSNWSNTTNAAATGDVVSLSFMASEYITPTVVFLFGTSAVAANVITYTNTSLNDGSTVWTAAYTVLATDAEGAVAFVLSYEDSAGNTGINTTATTDSTSVIVDHTVPSLLTVTISSSNGGMAAIAGIAPGVDLPVANTGQPWNNATNAAKAGDVVTLNLTASEFIYQPVVTFLTGSEPIAGTVTYSNIDNVEMANGQNISFLVSFIVQPSDTSGAVTFTITYSDASGNLGEIETEADITDMSAVVVDTTVPTLQVVKIVSNNAAKSSIAGISPAVDLPIS